MNRPLLCALALALAIFPAKAEVAVKSYSYFDIGGRTLDQIQNELNRRGPEVKTTGLRHPGATQMKFTTRIGYAQQPGSCRIVSAQVTVKTRIILPRWRPRGKVGPDVRLFWDTLSADIKRHEERHAEIAKNHARALEDRDRHLPRPSSLRRGSSSASITAMRTATPISTCSWMTL